MINYEAPLDEFNFLLHDYLKVSEQEIPGFSELTTEFTSEILAMGAKIAKEVMLPVKPDPTIAILNLRSIINIYIALLTNL